MMRTSVSLAAFSPSPTAPVLYHGDLRAATNRIKALGYDGVDLFIRDPWSGESAQARKLLAERSLGIGVVMPAAMAGMGLFLGDMSASVRDEIVRRMKDIISFAGETGSMVSLGLVRGSVKEGDTLEALLRRFAETTSRLLPHAQRCGVELLIEPINRYEINTLNSSLEAWQFIQDTGLPLGLMLDTFHMNIEDRSIEESLRVCMPAIRHIHFLDSNRLAPGMGHLDMAMIYQQLHDQNYEGYLCLEALPRPDGDTVAEAGAAFFRRMRGCAAGEDHKKQ